MVRKFTNDINYEMDGPGTDRRLLHIHNRGSSLSCLNVEICTGII